MADSTSQKSIAIPLTAFTVGAVVALLVGVFGRVHNPTLNGTTTLGYATVIGMKTVVTMVIAVLVVVQLITALWMYGKLGLRAPSWLGTLHRSTGGTALVLSLFVAYHCLWTLGLEVRMARTRRVKRSPPATGRNQPGARRERTATIFTTMAPMTAHPRRPCTSVRVLTGLPSGSVPTSRPSDQRQW